MMKVLVVIPARYASVRFPGKMLALVSGKPLILHVWANACAAKRVERVVVATDDVRIAEVVRGAGGEAVMTPPELPSGTDRVASVLDRETEAAGADDVYDYLVNVQGDEPLFTGRDLDEFIGKLDGAPMATLARVMSEDEDAEDPNLVKVVTGKDGGALYFSRYPIPYDRDAGGRGKGVLHHLGIYAYRPETLKKLVALPQGEHEIKEKLEQLRALENGIHIQVIRTQAYPIGVDVPEDVRRVESLLSKAGESLYKAGS